MNQNDDEKFGILMAMLQENFTPGKEVSSHKMKLYIEFLNDLTIEQLTESVNYLIKNKKIPTFPTIGEIRTAILDSKEADAIRAWGTALNAAKAYANEPEFKDPMVSIVIRKGFGGWDKFVYYGTSDYIVETSDRRHFLECYKVFSIEHGRQQEAKKLQESIKGELEAMATKKASQGK